jgi:hypothetical protein
MKWKIILGLLIVFILLISITGYLVAVEPFETQDAQYTNEINTTITLMNDIICPINKTLVDDMKTDKMYTSDDTGTRQVMNEEQAKEAVLADLEQEAGGPLFVCPPPDDPIQLPADIDVRTERTLRFFLKKIETIKKSLLESMNKCGEGFEDICMPPPGQTKSPPPPTPPKQPQGCTDVSAVTPPVRSSILEARSRALQNLLKKEGLATLIDKVKVDGQELLETKRKAEAGELRPNCPQ